MGLYESILYFNWVLVEGSTNSPVSIVMVQYSRAWRNGRLELGVWNRKS